MENYKLDENGYKKSKLSLDDLDKYTIKNVIRFEKGKTWWNDKEEALQRCSTGGNTTKENKLGWFSLSEEDHKKNASKGGKTGASGKSQTDSGKIKDFQKAGTKAQSESKNNLNKQRWMCPNGHITTIACLKSYCNRHNLDLNKAYRIE